MPMQCFICVKVNFETEKNPFLPIEKFPFLQLAKDSIMFKCGPNLDTLFCVEVFVEFYIYTLTPHCFQFF